MSSMRTSSTSSAWATGGVIFAACIMILSGSLALIQGIAAVLKNHIYVTTPNYVMKFDVTSWGWIHIILGGLLILTGFVLFTGATWARALGIFFAVLSIFANFFFIPYYPFWAFVLIGLDVFVIWALATAPRMDADSGGYADSRSGSHSRMES
ncbi:MAG TPA: hypothetical protein VFR11_16920 [Micromonosporaceae bacterium]|nr:hypothetical protein [Micromonosporaceae bacterium]